MANAKQQKWDNYFMDIAEVVKGRSDCLRGSVGAVLVNKNNRIIATGYNGSPRGIKNCNLGGCERCLLRNKNKIKSGENKDKCTCVHAEANAIFQSANEGISTANTTCYTTTLPCVDCTKSLIQAGITNLFYKEDYDSLITRKLFKEAKIKIHKI